MSILCIFSSSFVSASHTVQSDSKYSPTAGAHSSGRIAAVVTMGHMLIGHLLSRVSMWAHGV